MVQEVPDGTPEGWVREQEVVGGIMVDIGGYTLVQGEKLIWCGT